MEKYATGIPKVRIGEDVKVNFIDQGYQYQNGKEKDNNGAGSVQHVHITQVSGHELHAKVDADEQQQDRENADLQHAMVGTTSQQQEGEDKRSKVTDVQ